MIKYKLVHIQDDFYAISILDCSDKYEPIGIKFHDFLGKEYFVSVIKSRHTGIVTFTKNTTNANLTIRMQDDKPIYYVTVASNSFISFSKEYKHNTIKGNYTVMTIRLDGSTESRRNELCIISSELTDMDKKIFNHSIKTWNSYSHQLEELSFNINDI